MMDIGEPALTANMHEPGRTIQDRYLIILGLLACFLAYTPLIAGQPDTVVIEGRVVADNSGLADSELTVFVNGQPFPAKIGGRYIANVPRADIYRLRFDGKTTFTGIYTFAEAELPRSVDGQYLVPDVELVARQPGRVELIFAGDVMMGRRFEKPLWRSSPLIRPTARTSDMAALLAPMADYLRAADFAAVNLETVLVPTEPPGKAAKSITFFSHPEAVTALKGAGVDYVTLGNNHVYDYLETGLQSTTATLDSAALLHSGAGHSEEAALKAARIDIGGRKYSMLGFVGWRGSVSPNQVAETGKGGAAYGTAENISRALKSEVADNRIAVVQYHGSREYSDAPTEISQARLRHAVDAGADLVVGHHPHVTHGLEIYQGKLIAYSLGNFLFDQYFFEAQLAYVLKVWMDGDQFYRAEAIPIQLLDYRPVPAVAGMREGVLRRLFSQSRAMGTRLSMSGGHAVIKNSAAVEDSPIMACPDPEFGESGVKHLSFNLATGPEACIDQSGSNQNWGEDIWHRGDFESGEYMDVSDQSWEVENADASLSANSRSGRHALQLRQAPATGSVSITPRTFLRVLNGSEYSVVGWIKTDKPVQLSASLQSRPTGINRFKALKEAEWKEMGSIAIRAGSWQPFRFDFEPVHSKKGKLLPMRPSLQMMGSDRATILVDDFAVIEQAETDKGFSVADRLRQNFWIDSKKVSPKTPASAEQ